jgi:oxygen-independent coproporphyrinogen-3 oxidase
MPDIPRAAYVHVPFCAHRCGYCNFTLVARRDDLIGPYLQAIELELQMPGQAHPVDTLFFGGGTPTHLPPEAFRHLLQSAREWFVPAEGAEISVEANPCDRVTSLLAECGVTRVSWGGQSFHVAKLQVLERDHTPEQLRAALRESIRQLPTSALDLIFGVPGETLDVWRSDLQTAIDTGVPHISTYGLTFERGTQFWNRRLHGELQSLDDELERDMYALAIDLLTAAGYEHYEVSNFAKPGHRCRHNETYWSGDPFFAVGPGAARFINGRREINHRSTTTYIKRMLAGQSPVAEVDELSPLDRARELLVVGLRRLQGVERKDFAARTGFTIDQLAGKTIERFVERGSLSDDGHTIRLTKEGLFVSDSLWPHLL